jgi:hypothetical protein
VLTHKKHIDMSNENTSVSFNELTLAEQAIVSQGIGWDGKTYTDPKSCIKIELVDGDVASYRVLDRGNQEEVPAQETVEETEPVAPEEETVASETATETETVEPTDVASEQTTDEVEPENGPTTEQDESVNTEATEPAPTE